MPAKTLNKLTLILPDNIRPGMEDHWFNRQLQALKGGHLKNYPKPVDWVQICEVADNKMVIVYESNDPHDRTATLELEIHPGELQRVGEEEGGRKMAKRGPGRPRVDA
jgi:hypothetical protein